MIFKKANISVMFLLAVSLNAYCQHANVMEYLDPNFQNASLLYNKAAVDDTPYLVNQLQPATIKMKDGKMLKDVEIKYDISDQLLLINSGNDLGILNSKFVDMFEIKLPGEVSNSTFIPLNYNGVFSYYQLLVDGDIKVLRKFEKKKRSKEQYTSTGYNNDGPKPSAFVKSDSYFLWKSEQLTQIKISKKSILSALNNPKYEACAKKLELRLNNIEDVSTLLNDCK